MKILITGGTGLVGSRFLELKKDQFEIFAPTVEELDILSPRLVWDFIHKKAVEAVVNLAAYTDVEKAEEEADDESGLVYRLNALAPSNIARICRDNNIYLVQISTDYVFSGKKEDAPYTEEDTPDPVNWYARTKHQGEEFVLGSGCKFAIVRIEMPYSSHYKLRSDFARFFISALREGKEVKAIDDQKITPVFVDSFADALVKIIMKKVEGIWHVASADWTAPFNFARTLADEFGLDKSLIKPVKFAEFNANRKALRPKNCWLDVSKFEREFGKGILKTNRSSIEQFKSKFKE